LSSSVAVIIVIFAAATAVYAIVAVAVTSGV
jgi:hypothetical protein